MNKKSVCNVRYHSLDMLNQGREIKYILRKWLSDVYPRIREKEREE